MKVWWWLLFSAYAAFWLWMAAVAISGFGDMVGWWEYAEVCTPKDALAICWTGEK